VLDDPWAHTHALRTLERLRGEQAEPDAVAHTPGGVTGLLDDQVQAAQAALDAWEATGERRWLDWSVALMERVWRDYRDAEGGGLCDTALTRGGEGLLPARIKPVQDTPTPSPNGVAAITCARLATHEAPGPWADRRDELVAAFSGKAGELGLYGATFLLAVDWMLHPAAHLVVIGAPGDAVAEAMHRAALAAFLPRRVVQRLSSAPGGTPALPATMRGMLATAGTGPRAFACVGATCRAPAEDEGAWKTTLRALAEPPAMPQ
jgi:uncharacterized protein